MSLPNFPEKMEGSLFFREIMPQFLPEYNPFKLAMLGLIVEQYTVLKTPITQSNIPDKNSIPMLRPKRTSTKPVIIMSTEEINRVEKASLCGFSMYTRLLFVF